MKLKSCYISGFGIIENKEYIFDESLNSYCEDNGYGKTTLAMFIKSMFYGLPKTTTKSFDREHYLPFSGKQCGGNIQFTINNDLYKIERTFGKTQRGDTLKFYKNGLEMKLLDEEPGERLFKIDLESFNRLIFITTHDLEIKTTDSINSQISHYVQNTESDFDLAVVLKKLEEKIKLLKPLRSSDTKGNIAVLQNEIKNTEFKVNNLEEIKKTLDNKYVKYNEYKKQIDELSERIKKASTINEVIDNWEKHDSYVKDIKDTQEQIDDIINKYNNNFPEENEVNNIDSLYLSYKQDNEKLNKLVLSDNDKHLYEEYKIIFKDNVISEEELNDLNNEINKYNNNTDNLIYNKDIFDKYNNKYPTENELKVIDDLYSEYKETKTKYESALTIESTSFETKPKKKTSLLLTIISVVIIALGVMLGILISTPLMCISIIGVVLLILPLYFGKANQNNINNKGNIIIELKDKLYKQEINFNKYLYPYNLSTSEEESIEIIFIKFKNELNEFNVIKEKFEENNRIKISSSTKIEEVLNKYNLNDLSHKDALNKLIIGKNKYQELIDLVNKNNVEKSKLIESINKSLNIINEFIKEYNIEIENIPTFKNQYLNDKAMINSYKLSIEITTNKLNKLKVEKNLVNRPESIENAAKEDIESLTNSLNNINGLFKNLEKEINNDENEIEAIDDLNNKIIESNELLNKYNEDLDILNNTKKYLELSESSLKNKYVSPIKQSFDKYIDILERTLGEKFEINANYELKIIKDGIERDYRHLSSGQMVLAILCYRLAIIDNIFEDINPILIIDDIFNDLDEKNLDKSIEFIKSISKIKQIIYFTCHESRKI